MYNFKTQAYLKIILVISLISIISAYFIEYVLEYQPCNLCIIERIPYGLSIILIFLNYILIKNEKFIILLLIMVFAFSIIISFYHFGIEKSFFEESAICRIQNVSDNISKEELLKQLQVIAISCKDVTFKIFGFSLTTVNLILSIFLTILLINIFINYEKFKK